MQINKTMHGIPHEHPTSLDVNKLIALFNQGKFSEMESHARQLTSHFPNDGLSWQAMGVALHQQGQHSAALKPLQQASVLLPNDAQVHNNLANTFVKLGRFSDAEISYRRALELSPKFTEAHFNLGNTLVKLGRQDEAEQSYRESLAIRQDFVEALNGFAIMLIAQGRLAEALALAFHAVKLKTSWENKNVVVQCLREIRFTDTSEELQTIMTPALSEPWGRPTYLVRAAADLIKLNPVIADCIAVLNRAWPKRLSSQELFGSTGISPIANDAVLLALLDATPVCDVELEKMLTMLRHAMLESATTSNPEMTDSSTLFFYGALARQCFINEYVFGWTKDESKKAYELRDSLVADMGNGVPISELILVTVAAYFPLHTLEFSEKLLEATWSDALNKVLSMQVAEPFEEARLRASIPKLTTIENGISLLVQSMYEENPYPRWIKVAPTGNSTSINEFIQQRYPMSSFKPLQKADQANILIAGCGTGQQPIQTAQQFPNAKVLAIDISSLLSQINFPFKKDHPEAQP